MLEPIETLTRASAASDGGESLLDSQGVDVLLVPLEFAMCKMRGISSGLNGKERTEAACEGDIPLISGSFKEKTAIEGTIVCKC